jgi:hypothetical protein
MQKWCFLCLLGFNLLTPPWLFGQDVKLYSNQILFKDTQTNQAVLIGSDSILYKGLPLKKTKYNHTAYPGKITDYSNVFHIKGKTYLTHSSCGAVLEYRNDSIVRIDNSFLHQNQISATSFVYNNEIYYFGGYGLFTFKNILTRYDFKLNEWLEVQTHNEPPAERSSAIGIKIKNDFYVFGGITKDSSNVEERKKITDLIVWRLHLPTMKWNKIGTHVPLTFNELQTAKFIANTNLYLINDANTYEINILSNQIKKYKNKTGATPKNLFFDAASNKLTYLHFQSKNDSYILLQTELSNFLGKSIKEQTFISYTKSYFTLCAVLIGFVLLGLVFLGWKYIATKTNTFNGIEFNSTTKEFLCKGKIINSLESNEFKILSYFMSHMDTYIPLNELNNLLENTTQQETMAAIIKRRDAAMNGLALKLHLITGKETTDFLIEQKSTADKRIKEIMFLSKYIRIR